MPIRRSEFMFKIYTYNNKRTIPVDEVVDTANIKASSTWIISTTAASTKIKSSRNPGV